MIGVRALAKAITYTRYVLNNIQFISDKSSAELILYLGEQIKSIEHQHLKNILNRCIFRVKLDYWNTCQSSNSF